jgi:hypothetical protein
MEIQKLWINELLLELRGFGSTNMMNLGISILQMRVCQSALFIMMNFTALFLLIQKALKSGMHQMAKFSIFSAILASMKLLVLL